MKLYLSLFFSFSLFFVYSQPQILASKRFKSDSISAFNRIISAENGEYYVGGYITSPENPYHTNAYFAKMKENGDIIWEKIIDKQQDARLIDFAINDKREFVLLIHVIFKEGKRNKTLSFWQKWDMKGNYISELPVNEAFNLLPPIKMLPSGEYLIGIRKNKIINDSTTESEMGIAKLAENGNFVWTKTFEAQIEDSLFYTSSFSLLPNQNIVFVASVGLEYSKVAWQQFRENTQNICLIYCDENGNEMSRKKIPTNASINSFNPTNEGDFMLLGSIYDKAEEDTDVYLAKLSTEKESLIWEKVLHFYKSDAAYNFMEMPNKQYLISGVCSGGWLYNTTYTFLANIDNEGKTIWTKVFRDGNLVIDGIQKADGSYFFTGLFSERFVQPEEEDNLSHEIINKNDAMLISLSENSCIWEKNLFIGGDEQAFCLEKSPKGGYFVAGIDFSGPTYSGNSLFLFKIAENGELEWRQELGYWGASMEVPVCLIATEEGGCIAINNSGELFCFSKNGIVQWKSKDYKHKDIAGIVEMDKKNSLLAGSVWKDYPDKALWLGKINETGKLIWEKEYDLAQPIEVWDIAKTEDEGFVITGEYGEIGSTKVVLIKIDKDGKLLWEKSYALGKHANAKSVIALKDGGYAIAGIVYSPEVKYQAFVIKTDEKGEKEWSKLLVKSDDNVASAAVTIDNDGNLILASSHKFSNYKGDQEIYVCKMNVQGKILWEKAIGGGNSHYLGGIAMSPDNQIMITGYSNYLAHNEDSNVYFVKIKNE